MNAWESLAEEMAGFIRLKNNCGVVYDRPASIVTFRKFSLSEGYSFHCIQ